MNWHVTRSQHTLDMILALPVEGQLALLDLIEALENDPYPVTEPYGIDDKITRQAVFGNGAGLAVLMVNAITQRITVLSLTWAG
ncbi:hypothetical protein F9278_00160 (plasmid) [Streptomyces phaeolivaceus]|uniref:Uncharacterized protein n=1 Tax=Streptomyces phaeolivaceus TaxID=2653200 RepID=A0A5P8JWS3_9ACTN|nr:hypothetical protein [Streptomyces phaeolivaceus]QFQ94869.1 hypothetical protein F9278_00160 [Streptomyces phaeolivaceus]